ncbi:MAG TPA: TRAP transporter small permease [Sneathiellales bacterium]|nr:TRAP transporter small permease [Sneathiellales bacterium]
MNENANFAGNGLKWVDRLSTILAVVGGVAIVFLVGLTVVGVFFRYVLNDPIFGMDDLATLTLSVIVAGSMAYGARAGSHVYVDILGMVGGRRVTRYTDIFARGLGAVVVGLSAYALVKQGSCGIRCGNFTPNLAIEHRPFYMLLAVSMGLYSVILVLEMIVGLFQFRASEDPNEYL